jgi:hypothetical protein
MSLAVRVSLHPGGSAACGCPLLSLRWMVAGVGDTTNHAEIGTPSER